MGTIGVFPYVRVTHLAHGLFVIGVARVAGRIGSFKHLVYDVVDRERPAREKFGRGSELRVVNIARSHLIENLLGVAVILAERSSVTIGLRPLLLL
jgi:hypothetical protein